MKSTLLVIDDQIEIRTILSGMFREQDYHVLVAENGEAGLQTAREHLPDLILLDILMGDMDGFEVCRRLKKDALTRHIPVIFITGLQDGISKVSAFDAGGTDYITKPFFRMEVMARVNTHLLNHHLIRQIQAERDRFRALSEAATETILLFDETRIIDVNRAAEHLSGYSRDELTEMTIQEIVPGAGAGKLADMLTWFNGRSHLYLRDRDQSLIPVEIRGDEFDWRDRKVGILAIRDLRWRWRLESENENLRANLKECERFGEMVGRSVLMKKLYDRIVMAAASDETVIIYGETGTGKELAARTIFNMSTTHNRAFVSVNCGAVQESLFESLFFGHRKGAFTSAVQDQPGYLDKARGGTLFLDEVGELTPTMQSKLLRVLQEGEYTPVGATESRVADVRVIAATNQELRRLIREGRVREDFFHRLHVIALEVPPLRMRREDIPLLVRDFLERRALSHPGRVLPLSILERFHEHHWPGNVRELFNEIRRYLTTGEVELAGADDAGSLNGGTRTSFIPEGLDLNDALDAFEKYYITRILRKNGGHKVNTAKALGVGRQTLYNKLKRHAIGG